MARILYHHRTMADDGQAVHIRSLQKAFEAEGHDVLEVGLVRQGDAAQKASSAAGEPDKQRDAAGAHGHSSNAGGGDSPKGKAEGGQGDSSGRSRWGWIRRVPRFVRELAEYSYSAIARDRIIKAAQGFEPDFIYERYAFGNAAGVMAAKRLKCPLVLEVNSPMVLELSKTRGLSFPRLAARMEQYIFRGADLVCVVTNVLREMLIEMGVQPERLLVTPNGVHPEQYAQPGDSHARMSAREALGLGDTITGPVLGFVGYYRDWHRLDLVLESMLAPSLRECHLILVGMGPAEAALLAKAEELGLRERLHIAGPRPHASIPRLLPAFDVALVPAINAYASPLKLHEYMAAGCAVVAPDQPNLREVVNHEQNGLLIEPGDQAALQAALSRLVEDPQLRSSLGSNARATILERDLTWRGNAKRVVRAMGEMRL